MNQRRDHFKPGGAPKQTPPNSRVAPAQPAIQRMAKTQGPVAPPVYRPLPVPKVLQRKMAMAGPRINQLPHVLQKKEIARPPTAPLAARPGLNQPAKGNQRSALVPRPGAPRPMILQPKVVQRARAKWDMGQSDEEMSNQQWAKSGMSTFASIMVEDEDGDLTFESTTKNLKTKTHGAEHAEDVAMRFLLENYSAAELGKMAVLLNLSKSPCSSTCGTSGAKNPGCAENLVHFAKTYKVKIAITCRGLYKGLDASQDAIEWMRANGIDVSVDVRVGREKRFGEHP